MAVVISWSPMGSPRKCALPSCSALDTGSGLWTCVGVGSCRVHMGPTHHGQTQGLGKGRDWTPETGAEPHTRVNAHLDKHDGERPLSAGRVVVAWPKLQIRGGCCVMAKGEPSVQGCGASSTHRHQTYEAFKYGTQPGRKVS